MAEMLPDLVGPDATPFGLSIDAPDGPVADVQLIQISNNPYTLSSVAGFGSRPRLDSGVLGVATLTVHRASEVNRLVALGSWPAIPNASKAGISGPLARWTFMDHRRLPPRWTANPVSGSLRCISRVGRVHCESASLRGVWGFAGLSSGPHQRFNSDRSGAGGTRQTERNRSLPGRTRELTRSAGEGRLPTGNGYLRSLDWVRRLAGEVDALDRSVYDAISATPTPTLDEPVTRLFERRQIPSLLWMMVAFWSQHRRRSRSTPGSPRPDCNRFDFARHLRGCETCFPPPPSSHRAVDNVRSEARMPTSSSFPSGHTALRSPLPLR